MKITIVTVGKIKEKYFTDAIAEYSKRLSRYCKLEIVQVADEKTPAGASEALENQIKDKEGERILANIKDGSYVIQRPFVLVTMVDRELSDAAFKFFNYVTSGEANEIISATGVVPAN